jgi:hypothetical protein
LPCRRPGLGQPSGCTHHAGERPRDQGSPLGPPDAATRHKGIRSRYAESHLVPNSILRRGPRPSIRILRPADPIMRDQTAAIFRRPVDLDERRRFYDPASRPAGGRSRRPKITIIGPRNRPALR